MLTPSEHYHLHGALPVDMLEQLIDRDAARFDAIDRAGEHLSQFEIGVGFPGEDVLQLHIEALRGLAKRMRSSFIKTELEQVTLDIEELAAALRGNAEHGAFELSKAAEAFELLARN